MIASMVNILSVVHIGDFAAGDSESVYSRFGFIDIDFFL